MNLTRFPLFFSEKRAFFLQDTNYFNFGGIQASPLPFFTRKIGLSNTGEPIDLIGGMKLTGRSGPVKGKGYRNLEERLPATEDTLFAIGSTTKAFTALS